ncbi:MAG: hypothetical protein M3548_20260 [Actinomycetota bacterium]|nr:hypothetical protein [Actinomycetota bacterium]
MPIQRDQGVPTQQLRLCQTNQQLTGGGATVTLLDRPDPAIERADHVELGQELRDCGDPRRRGQ